MKNTDVRFSELPFDVGQMLAGLQPWVECESPTHDAGAVDRMVDLAAADLAGIGATIERIPGRLGFGGCVRARLPHRDFGEPGILVAGHLDTVHPVGTLKTLPFRREGSKCYGPGILDMKGGNYLALEAIRQLARAGIETPLPVTILFTPDEEVGTPTARAIIETEAGRSRFVLIPEPGRAGNGVVTGRYAIARFNIETIGRPSHAGSTPGEGRSAIREMARRILEIEAMTSEDCTFSVGVVRGGEWVNCVSSFCRGEVLSMAKRQEDLDAGIAKMLALAGSSSDVTFAVRRGVTRPVWPPDQPQTLALYEHANRLAKSLDFDKSLGFDMPHGSHGGGSDGNFTGALGIPTLDGLGLLGADLHTLNEHIEIGSLLPRGRLMAGLLATLA